MKLLLDENMPRQLMRFFDQHETTHVKYLGWQELKNGELLTTMREESFDVLVTTDVSIFNQQKARYHGIAIIILRVFNNKIESIRPLVDAAQSAAPHVAAWRCRIHLC